ncbi:hypothetical protein [Micromonospora halophytica]|uniref:Uncharacterized protein n=1 Tax=Micromonospora halophytica TaxID=47864 RepID=A0A1C5GTK3_9ACTN|nr:hypothetical protein [Micromonospora halophytica]SCG36877.1 hypothetical protein GA0070560_10237 [Micromonospora halophytica]
MVNRAEKIRVRPSFCLGQGDLGDVLTVGRVEPGGGATGPAVAQRGAVGEVDADLVEPGAGAQ